HQLEALGADIFGVNCRLGPHHTIQALEDVSLPQKAFLSAYPKASLLDLEIGRVVYESEADCFWRAGLLLREEGARLIGGCCGTTPKHIEALKKRIGHLKPVTEKEVVKKKPIIIREAEALEEAPLHEKAKTERTIIVEL